MSISELKTKANEQFSLGNWKRAAELYTEAINLDADQENPVLLGKLYSNRSAAMAMMEYYETALKDANRALDLCPTWSRGFARKSVALIGLNRISEALDSVQEGLNEDPSDKMLNDLLSFVNENVKDGSDNQPTNKRKGPEDSSIFAEVCHQIEAAGISTKMPVVVLSGFLGSGKTTLLHRILQENDGQKKIAVFVNDMAEINIDSELVKQNNSFAEVSEELVELTNGCVCCTLRGDLVKVHPHSHRLDLYVLKEATKILCAKKFDLLVIEATGISEPMPVAATFVSSDFHGASLRPYFWIDNMVRLSYLSMNRLGVVCSKVTLVDCSQFLIELRRGESLKDRRIESDDQDRRSISNLLIDQVEFADTILINKTDLASLQVVEETSSLLRSLNSTAHILSCERAEVPLREILDTGRFRIDKAESFDGFKTEILDPHTSETEEFGIGSVVFESRLPFHPVRLYQFVFGRQDNQDESRIADESPLRESYRSKGFFYLANNMDAKLSWSTAGSSISFELANRWLASMVPENIWPPDWDPRFGDREQKLVIIGKSETLQDIKSSLADCLLTQAELITSDWSSLDPDNLWLLDDLDSDTSSVK